MGLGDRVCLAVDCDSLVTVVRIPCTRVSRSRREIWHRMEVEQVEHLLRPYPLTSLPSIPVPTADASGGRLHPGRGVGRLKRRRPGSERECRHSRWRGARVVRVGISWLFVPEDTLGSSAHEASPAVRKRLACLMLLGSHDGRPRPSPSMPPPLLVSLDIHALACHTCHGPEYNTPQPPSSHTLPRRLRPRCRRRSSSS